MKLNRYMLIAFLTGLLSLLGFSLIAFLISTEKIADFDHTVISIIQGFENETLTSMMKFFTFIGTVPVVLVIFLLAAIFLYRLLKHRAEVILMGTAIVGALIFNQVLKVWFQRARPELHRLIETSGYSFPSGHAMASFALYGILTFILWRHIGSRWGRVAILFISTILIVTIGISRIYLGVHYPSDIIGGYLASGIWLAIVISFFQRYKEQKK